MSKVEEMLKIAREQEPELWKVIDEIAYIVDPGAFTDAPGDTEFIRVRLAFMQAAARSKAWQILVKLQDKRSILHQGPWHEFDWTPVLEEYARRMNP